jgi:hypothetical protein
MRGLPSVETSDRFRTRRWDAVVLGGALPGLIAAVRLAMNRARVLVLEETAAAEAFPGMREPFLVSGAKSDGILGQCLRALGIPLIDRQRIASDPLAYQVAFPDARVDVGERLRTSEELVAWSFADPKAADALLKGLGDAAAAERDAMLDAPVVRAPRRLPLAPRRPPANLLASPAPEKPKWHARGLPAEVSEAPARLASLCAAQARALSNLGAAVPSPEALARLLGLSQEGSAIFAGGEYWVHALLRRRIESLHGGRTRGRSGADGRWSSTRRARPWQPPSIKTRSRRCCALRPRRAGGSPSTSARAGARSPKACRSGSSPCATRTSRWRGRTSSRCGSSRARAATTRWTWWPPPWWTRPSAISRLGKRRSRALSPI